MPLNKKHLNVSIKLIKENYAKIFIFTFLFTFAVSFLLTKQSTSHTSELSYVENSKYERTSASIVPASCDSGTPHNGEVCGTWQAADCPSWYVCGSATTYIPYSCVGSNTAPGCAGSQPADKVCTMNTCTPWVGLSFNGAPTKPAVTVTLNADKTTVPYGQSGTIYWSSPNATRCLLKNGYNSYLQTNIGSITTPARTDLSPNSFSITFSIECSNGDTPVPAGNTVTVTYIGFVP